MSRVGKQPIPVPKGVQVDITNGVFTAKSAKGQLTIPVPPGMQVVVDAETVTVTPSTRGKNFNAFWGLTRALLNNAVKGVDQGWAKVLELRGVGYRAQIKGKVLDLTVGMSHPVEIEPPSGITFETGQENVDGENIQVITIKGIDKQAVGDIAATIRDIKPPEPYKGKGIRYRGEYVRRKSGKATG